MRMVENFPPFAFFCNIIEKLWKHVYNCIKWSNIKIIHCFLITITLNSDFIVNNHLKYRIRDEDEMIYIIFIDVKCYTPY